MLGASRLEQLEQNLAALEVVAKLDAGVLKRIDEALG
jgi:aryl-alcohol dehydrogenase-like predicted oxidoreductase